MENLRLIKKITRNRLEKNFDSIYLDVKKLALDKFNYKNDLRIISDRKWVNFYIINDGTYINESFEYNIDD